MQTTELDKTVAPAELAPAELTESELNRVNGGLLPAVAPAGKGKCPTAVE